MLARRLKLAAIALIALGGAVPMVAEAQYYGRGYYAPPPPPPPPGYYGRRYYGPPPAYYDDRRGYRGGRGYRGRGRCDRGTGGTIIGAIAGGLLGNAVAGRGDRGVGTVVGAGAGALAGRSIDRDC